MEKDNQTAMGLQDIIEMLIRRRKLFFFPFIAIFCITLVVGFFLPKTYEASSIVQIRAKKIIDPLVIGIAVTPGQGRSEFDVLTNQVMAWPRMEQLVAQLHLADGITSPALLEDFIKKLKERITIKMKNADMIEISYQHVNPMLAQQVVNMLTQNFIDENARVKSLEARTAIDFINEQLKIYKNKLENSQEDFMTNKIDSDLRIATNRRTLLKERIANLQKIIPSQITTQQNPVVSQLQTRQGQLESELSRLMLDAKEGNPRVVELKQEIITINAKISEELGKGTVKESISTFNPLYLQTEQELRQAEMDISYLEKRKEDLKKGSKNTSKIISEEDVANLERNKRVDEDIYQMLLRQLESAYVSERLQDSEKGSRFTVIEYARVPIRPIKPKMIKIIGVGFVGGLLFGLGCVFALESFTKSFHTLHQAKEVLPLQSLGSITKIVNEEELPTTPHSKFWSKVAAYVEKNKQLSQFLFVEPYVARKKDDSAVSHQVVMYHGPRSNVAEEYRVARTNIFHGVHEGENLKIFVITSTLRGEGKSTTSANLAVTFANSGRKTLLIDSDLRRGVSHELFGIAGKPGLTDVLSGKDSIQHAVVTTSIDNLSILPCGSSSQKPSELIGSPAMKSCVENLRSQYDAIIIDAPPVLNLPDAGILSRYCDGMILIVQSGRTKQKDVLNAVEILKQLKAKMIGFIFTGAQYHMPRYMYNYYYYKYEAGEEKQEVS